SGKRIVVETLLPDTVEQKLGVADPKALGNAQINSFEAMLINLIGPQMGQAGTQALSPLMHPAQRTAMAWGVPTVPLVTRFKLQIGICQAETIIEAGTPVRLHFPALEAQAV